MYTIKNIEFNYSEGCSLATIITNKGDFIGTAWCHEEDIDMESEKTGLAIAETRAYIELYKQIKYDLQIELAALKQYFHTIKHSKKFNKNSYENRMLQRRIRQLEKNLTTIKETIDCTQKDLRFYISEKEKMYQNVRLRRKGSEELKEKEEKLKLYFSEKEKMYQNAIALKAKEENNIN